MASLVLITTILRTTCLPADLNSPISWFAIIARCYCSASRGAFRRSELVSLDVADLDFTRAGLIVTLRRAKTDQEGAGRRIGIPYGANELTCPVRPLQAWLAAAKIKTGPVFRAVDRFSRVQPGRLSDKAVAQRVVSINDLATVTTDVVSVAGEGLVIGSL